MNKKKYLLLVFAAVTVLAMFSPTLTFADELPPATVNIYAWTDKPSYDPGEKGTLKIVIRNDRTDQDLILYNITVTYPWFSYTGEKWEGNDTIIVDEAIQKDGGIKTYSREFTVPSDGRVASLYVMASQIQISLTVDKTPYRYTKSAFIYVKGTYLYMALEDGDRIITLFTIQIVLLIVCTIIIAATIFLSVRKPQAPLFKEEEQVK